MDTTLEIFIARFRDQFTLLEDEEVLNPETVYTELSGWDSLTALMILDMIDDQYDVGLTGVELRDCECVQALYDLIMTKKSK
jgi:acyl carrier protein